VGTLSSEKIITCEVHVHGLCCYSAKTFIKLAVLQITVTGFQADPNKKVVRDKYEQQLLFKKVEI
jgi:hypothetical protein